MNQSKLLPKKEQFPFLELPFVARSEVLSKLGLLDLFTFSICSKKTKAIVAEKQLKIEWIGIELDVHKLSIILKTSEKSESSIKWVLKNHFVVRDFKSVYVIDGKDTFLQTLNPEEFNNSVLLAIEHVVTVFKRPIDCVGIENCRVSSWEESPIWNVISKTQLVLHGETVTDQELETLFNKIEVHKLFVSFAKGNCLFLEAKYDSFVNFDCLAIQSAIWAENTHLERFNGRVLQLGKTKITVGAINQWLKAWKSGAYENAEFVFIGFHKNQFLDSQILTRIVMAGLVYEQLDRMIVEKVVVNHCTLGALRPKLMMRGPGNKIALIGMHREVIIKIKSADT